MFVSGFKTPMNDHSTVSDKMNNYFTGQTLFYIKELFVPELFNFSLIAATFFSFFFYSGMANRTETGKPI